LGEQTVSASRTRSWWSRRKEKKTEVICSQLVISYGCIFLLQSLSFLSLSLIHTHTHTHTHTHKRQHWSSNINRIVFASKLFHLYSTSTLTANPQLEREEEEIPKVQPIFLELKIDFLAQTKNVPSSKSLVL